jgi:hypothetical protein
LELARIFPDTVPVPDGPTAPFRFTFRYPRIDYPFDMTCRRFVAFGDWEPDSGTVPRDLLAVECDVGDQNIAVMYGEADALVELVDSAVARGWVEAIVIESWDMPVITGLFIGRRTSSDGG